MKPFLFNVRISESYTEDSTQTGIIRYIGCTGKENDISECQHSSYQWTASQGSCPYSGSPSNRYHKASVHCSREYKMAYHLSNFKVLGPREEFVCFKMPLSSSVLDI